MANGNKLLEQLQEMLHWKKSKEYYAQKLNITVEEVSSLLKELRESGSEQDISFFKDKFGFVEDVKNNKAEATFDSPEKIKNLEDLIHKSKIDTNIWEITKWIQNFWGNEKDPHWQVKVWLEPVSKDFRDIFIEFLKTYKPSSPLVKKRVKEYFLTNTCLIINKQDSHLNKYSINGDNSIEERFNVIEDRVSKILRKASISSNLHKVVYVIGSDEFNSEYTNTTVKGTPQQNVLPYQESFKIICEHEVSIITKLLQFTDNLEVIYIPGNHDEYVGYHMASWLQVYFRNQSNITFDISPEFTKYIKFSNSAMMFNHGDCMKPEKMAQNFPIEFKEHWSSCDHYYIFSGDKHSELTRDIGGIKFYRIPALSKAKSRWDSQNGYTTNKAEMTAFLIEEENGITDLYKELI